MTDHSPRSTPILTIAAVVAILLALAAIGWKATYFMGRVEGSGSAASSSFLAWTLVALGIVGIGTALASMRAHGGPGTGNRRAAWVTIAIAIVILVLALTAGP